MNIPLGILTNIYNRLYLFFVAPFALTKNQLGEVDKKVQDVICDCGFPHGSSIPAALSRDIKVRIIKEYKMLKNCQNLDIELAHIATKVHQKLAIQSIPKDSLKAEGREAESNLKPHNNRYLDNKELKALAEEVDKNLSKNLNLREFTQLVIKTKTTTQKILLDSKPIAGTEELMEASEALVSQLKTHKRFFSALGELESFRNGKSGYDFLENTYTHYQTACVGLESP